MKSYLSSRMIPSAHCSDDREWPKSPSVPTFGDAAITGVRVFLFDLTGYSVYGVDFSPLVPCHTVASGLAAARDRPEAGSLSLAAGPTTTIKSNYVPRSARAVKLQFAPPPSPLPLNSVKVNEHWSSSLSTVDH